MSLTSWPTTTQLDSRLSGLGVSSFPTGLDKQRCIDAAVALCENITGQKPFLIDAAAADHPYDPPRTQRLFLRTRFPDVTSVSLDGDTLTEEEQYWLEPPGDGPYEAIRFLGPVTGLPQTLVVNGKRGYNTEIPPDLWDAVLDMACVKPVRAAVASGTVTPGGISEIKQGTVDLKFGGSGSSGGSLSTADQLEKDALAVFMRYQVPGVA